MSHPGVSSAGLRTICHPHGPPRARAALRALVLAPLLKLRACRLGFGPAEIMAVTGAETVTGAGAETVT